MNTARNTAFNSCLDQWDTMVEFVSWMCSWSHLVQLVVEIKDAFYIIRIISIQLMSHFSLSSHHISVYLSLLPFPPHSILASASITSVLLLLSFMAMAVHPKGLSNIQTSSFRQSPHLTLLLDIFWDLEMQFIYNFIFIGIQLIYSTVLIWEYITKLNQFYIYMYLLFILDSFPI